MNTLIERAKELVRDETWRLYETESRIERALAILETLKKDLSGELKDAIIVEKAWLVEGSSLGLSKKSIMLTLPKLVEDRGKQTWETGARWDFLIETIRESIEEAKLLAFPERLESLLQKPVKEGVSHE